MAGASLQKKLDKAHKKVGKKIGWNYAVYRPLSNIDPLDLANYIGDAYSGYSLADNFVTATVGWQQPMWNMYTDMTFVQQGDFLHSEETNRTFFIFSRQPILPVYAIECPERVDILTVGYSDEGDGFTANENTYVVRNLPCTVAQSAISVGSIVPASNVAKAGVRTLTIVTSLVNQPNIMGMTLKVGDFQGDIINFDFAPLGNAVRITAQEFGVQ